MDCSPAGSLSLRIPRKEYQIGLPVSCYRGSSQCRDQAPLRLPGGHLQLRHFPPPQATRDAHEPFTCNIFMDAYLNFLKWIWGEWNCYFSGLFQMFNNLKLYCFPNQLNRYIPISSVCGSIPAPHNQDLLLSVRL